MTPWNDPDSKSQIGAARGKTGSSFRKHRHMMDARKLLINLLYRATAQSSELPGWSHRETKKGPQSPGGDCGPVLSVAERIRSGSAPRRGRSSRGKDRKSAVEGRRGTVSVGLGGRRDMKKK